MNNKSRASVTLNANEVEWFDFMKEVEGWANRSQLIHHILRLYITKWQAAHPDRAEEFRRNRDNEE